MIGAETIVILPAGVLRVQIGIANPQFVAAHAVADLLQDSGFSLAEQVVLEINILFNQHFAQSQDHCRVTRGKYKPLYFAANLIALHKTSISLLSSGTG